ncbi:MAG: hypothetical protein NZV14_18525 [Bryobacteraceae bacterium]|nr:hypothetical protein [Bryobacteraceae bacterium]MDW8380163.1 hypothetical protein [Bryobacterales bacterium]
MRFFRRLLTPQNLLVNIPVLALGQNSLSCLAGLFTRTNAYPAFIHTKEVLMKPLHVVAVISNPCRYRSRYELYRNFEKHVLQSGALLTTVEAAYGERPHQVTSSSCATHLQLRTRHELWHKENLINVGIQRLPPDWEYVAWIDADVLFARPDWARETVEQLQHYHVVQMWTHAQDLNPNYEPTGEIQRGFVWSYYHDPKPKPNPSGYGTFRNWHPGYAWAARREFIDAVGGLIDWAILGSADTHMACALIGQAEMSMHPNLSPRYRKKVQIWQERAERHVRRNLGYVHGLLLHYWHGRKRDRGYNDRWKILVEHGFDPDLDLKRDHQGLWQLTERSHRLRDDIRAYFRSRNEDSIDE